MGRTVKTWSWQDAVKAEAKLWILEAVHQLLGWPLSPLQKHILRERAKMTRKLWLSVMYDANWYCQIRYPGCTGRAQEVDHIKPLFKYGYTERSNLQAACHFCNRKKGVN